MSCNLITNRARSLKSLIDQGIIDYNQEILEEGRFNEASINKTKELEALIGSKIPANEFAFGTNGNFINTNDDLFYRADAAEGILYEENYQYENNYAYSLEQVDNPYDPNARDKQLTDLLKNIGVTVESLTKNHRFKTVSGIADTFHKVAYASLNKAGVSTLPEEASHMFVEFIEQNEPKLFNKMMADIPKFGIYKGVKDEYLPIYNDLNQVKKEAIGKAISEYIVGNSLDPNQDTLTSWFDKVLDAVRKVLEKFGILTEAEYNNYFELTANKILKGDFVGTFEGSNTFLSSSDESGPLKRIDDRAALLELRTVTKNGVQSESYFYNGQEVKHRVTEKIRDKNQPVTPSTPSQLIAQAYGKAGHEDLLNLWKIKVGELDARTYTPRTATHIFAKLSNFVDIVHNQFPAGTVFRPEVKIYDPKSDTAGTIDLLAIEPDGTTNILDYKFMEKAQTTIPQLYSKQLGEYRRILRNSYGVEKFGQLRVIPFQTKYVGKLENKTLADIDLGTNSFDPSPERSHLNPMPANFETTKDERINRTLQYLNEELARNEKVPTSNEVDRINKRLRRTSIQQTIARLQITRDITSLESIAESDKQKMEYILRKNNPTPNELITVYRLKEYYRDFITNQYNVKPDGTISEELTSLALYAQEQSKLIDEKLEAFFNQNEIDTNQINKPISWFGRLTQLSDHDNPAFKALYRLLNKGFAQNEIKVKKEFQEIKGILDQIRKETGKTGVDMYAPIIQKDAKGKLTNKLIPMRKSEWYDMHKEVYGDPKLRSKLNQYFDHKAWKEYYDPLEKDFIDTIRGLNPDSLDEELKKFKSSMERNRGIGKANSRFFVIPDKFLNEDYLKYVKNAPDSGLAKLYNKYVAINRFASQNADTNISSNMLPYVRKSTMEMLINDGFNFRNLTDNALDKLKSYDWETYDIDSNGEKIYKIPLRFKGTNNIVQEDQSHDLGEMLMLWTESVYNNAYLNETHSTAGLYQLALKKSKEAIVKNGKPVLENGELRTTSPSTETLKQYQEYLNMYYYGVTNEKGDFDVLGYSGNKIVKAAMQYLSGTAIGFNIFSGFANLTGGFGQAISVGAKGNFYTNKQLGKALTSLHDPKMRGLLSLMDITNGEFKRDRAASLSASKADSLITWDKLFILQQGGDWVIQNSVLGAMAQNYTIKDKKIVKKEEGDKSLIESLNYDKDGKLIIEGLDISDENNYLELLKFREKVRRVGSEVTGLTSEYDKYLAKNTLVGQLLLHFRGWIPALAVSRFGNLKYNSNLEEYQIGKYKSTWRALGNKKILTIAQQYITQQNSPVLDQIIQEEYEKELTLNPNLTIEEFKKLYAQNMHSVFTEVALLGLISAFLLWLDDDDDDNIAKKILSRGLARTASELSFWYNTDSFTSIIQAPIPLIGLVSNTLSLLRSSGEAGLDYVFGTDFDPKIKDKASKLVPGINSYYRLMKDLDED